MNNPKQLHSLLSATTPASINSHAQPGAGKAASRTRGCGWAYLPPCSLVQTLPHSQQCSLLEGHHRHVGCLPTHTGCCALSPAGVPQGNTACPVPGLAGEEAPATEQPEVLGDTRTQQQWPAHLRGMPCNRGPRAWGALAACPTQGVTLHLIQPGRIPWLPCTAHNLNCCKCGPQVCRWWAALAVRLVSTLPCQTKGHQ
jgi:hypothetical protein